MAAVLRLFRLGSQNLWIDEVFTWRSAFIGRPIGPQELLENIHGPLYSLILHAWGSVAGDSEWALRLPSALLGIALVPAIAWAASRWLGEETAVPAAWLAAGSPFLVWYSQEARNYSMLMLCSTLGAVALLGLRRRITPGGLAGWLAAVAAGLLSNLSLLLLAPLHAWWWLGEPGRRLRRLAAGAVVLGVVAVVLLPWAPRIFGTWDWSRLRPGRAAATGEPDLRHRSTFHVAAVPYALHAFAVGYGIGPPVRELRTAPRLGALAEDALPLAAEAVVFGALGVLALRALHRRRRLLEAVLWIVVPLALVSYIALHNFKVFHPRYVAVAAPAFLIAVAAAFADLRGRTRLVLALGVAALWGLSFSRHFGDPRYAKEDMRSAAALIAREGRPGQKIVAANSETLLNYYYRGPLTIEPFWLGLVARPDAMAARFEDAARSPGGAWIVLTRPNDLDPEGRFARYLDQRKPAARRHDLDGVTVWRLPPRGVPPAGTR